MKKIFFLTIVFAICFYQMKAQQPITGGSPIDITNAPYQVILKEGNEYICGGSIVAPNFILTAKHCVDGVSASSIQVVAGITCKNETNSSNTFTVSRIILHPDPNIDVALLQLSSNITYNTNRKAINYCSALDNSLYNAGNTVRVSGWGWLTPNGFDPTDCLRSVDVQIITNQQATNMFNDPYTIVQAHEVATAGVGNIRQGACHGDSGWPLVIWSETLQEYILIGVVSWGKAYCWGNNTNSPSVFVRVSNIVNWIISNTASISGPDHICTSATYEIQNLPTGVSVTWHTIGNITLSSLTGTTTTVYASPSGVAWISATLNFPGQIPPIYLPLKQIHAGVPNAQQISSLNDGQTFDFGSQFEDVITYYGAIPGHQNLFGIDIGLWQSVSGGGVYPWQSTGGYYSVPNINSMVRVSYPASSDKAIVEVKLHNQCGWSQGKMIEYLKPTSGGPSGPGPEPICRECIIAFSFSPNPVADELTVEFENLPNETDQPETYSVKLLDNSGQTRKQTSFKHHHKNGKPKPVKFNVSSLKPGTYYLHIEGNGKIHKEQIIIKK